MSDNEEVKKEERHSASPNNSANGAVEENGSAEEGNGRKSRSRSHSKHSRRSRSRGHSHKKSRRHRRSRSRSKSRSRSRDRRRSRRHRSRARSRSRSYDRRSRSRSPMSSRKRHIAPREDPPPTRCVGVFGLSLYSDEKTLDTYFSQYGKIENIQLVYDKKTGRSRGFGFIYYERVEDAINAKERAAGMEIDGHRVRCDFSITRRPHTPTPGIYMGKPTRRGEYFGSNRNRSPSPFYSGGGRGRSRSFSPHYRRRSRSASYSPRRE